MENHPVNFQHILASVQLALKAHKNIPETAVDDVTQTVEEACANSDDSLMMQSDYDEFMSLLDGVLDSIDGNGYGEQVAQLDSIRQRLESEDQAQSEPVRQ